MTLDRNTRVLGVVDAEIHPTVPQAPTSIPRRSRTRAKTEKELSESGTGRLGHLIQESRVRASLSFREASAMSRRIAKTLEDQGYFTSHGTLSDYEHLSVPPRHVQKIFSLCILYCVGFWDFLRAGNLALDFIGNDPMSDELCGRTVPLRPQPSDDEPARAANGNEEGIKFLSVLVDRWKEIPLFMRRAMPDISGLPHVSLSDIFWVGADREPIHPHLVNAALVAVNRRLKKPMSPPPIPQEQPVYMILKRGGGYLCGCCAVRQGALTVAVHRHPSESYPNLEAGKRVDAEVIGQVTAILRYLS